MMCKVRDVHICIIDEHIEGPQILARIPRRAGKLLAQLESRGLQMEAPAQWGNEGEAELKIQSEKVDDNRVVLLALEAGDLRFVRHG